MIIHVGFPKSGTSYLQRQIYPQISEINYIPHEQCKLIFKELLIENDLHFNQDTTKNAISRHLVDNKANLFSFESLVGPMFFVSGANRRTIAMRLKELGFKKIIITIRNQYSTIESIYKQYIQQGGVLGFNDFVTGKKKTYFKVFKLNFLNYHSLINLYKQEFGSENVLILLQEELLLQPSSVMSQLTGFLEVRNSIEVQSKKENKSLSLSSLKVLRFLNHFTYSEFRPSNILSDKFTTWKVRVFMQRYLDPYVFSKINSNNSLLTPDIRQILFSYYEKSNKKLQSENNLDLKQYNYPI